MDEFQEADVLWPAAPEHHHHDHGCCHRSGRHFIEHQQPHPAAQQPAPAAPLLSSSPVRIPVQAAGAADVRPTNRRHSWARSCCSDDGGADGHEGARTTSLAAVAAGGASPALAIVPPHVLAARRCCSEERVAAYSLCVGHGRTLKGRDLRAVRNAVLHMTGFLGGADDY